MIDVVREGLEWIASREAITSPLGDFIGLVVVVFTPIGLLIRYWVDRPRLAFRIEKADAFDGATFRIINIGRREAKDVRIRWVRQSDMEMELIPQPTVILAGESITARISIERDDLLAHGLGIFLDMNGKSNVLGWAEVTHREWIRRIQSGRCVVNSGTEFDKPLASCLSLSALPRRPVLQAYPWAAWLDIKLGFASRRRVKLEERREQADRARLNAARDVLQKNGIKLDHIDHNDDQAYFILGELSRRGWEYEYYPGGIGYEVVAKKTWYPSTSSSLRMTGQTLLEAVTLTLANAINDDAERNKLDIETIAI